MPTKFDQVEPLLAGVIDHDTYVSALCPFHDDSKQSLMVWKDNPPYFKCYGCNAHGSLGKLLRELQGWTAPLIVGSSHHRHALPSDLDALETLCYNAHKLLMGNYDPLANYLIQRGVENRIVPNRLGYYYSWYTIPIYDEYNSFIGAVVRASPERQKRTGMRFDTPKGQGTLLYVPDWKLAREADYLVLVFGMFDALALSSIGLPVCTSTAGKESTKVDMFEWCRKRIIIIPDKGEEQTGENLVNGLGWRGKQLLLNYPDGMKDPADIVQHGLTEIIFDGINRIQ